MFMARLARSPVVQQKKYVLTAMPQLQTEFALKRYKICVGDRLKEFPENDDSLYKIKLDKDIPYAHRLSYDTESILWLLFSWAAQIQPLKKGPENPIPATLWMDLTGGQGADDPRVGLVNNFRKNTCHPVYQDIETLLRSLLEQLDGYQEQIAQSSNEQDPSRRKDDYLSEAFQREILDFIVKNIDAPFMLEKISPKRRPKERGGDVSQQTVTSSVYTSGVKRGYETMEGVEEQSSGDPATKKVRF